MITWMQRHKKWLIITIWISTIAFVGAGFVGWGQYNYGDKAGAVAKVGKIEITQGELQKSYSRLYARYNQMFQGNFDEEKAKQFNLQKQALNSLVEQALLLNLAKSFDLDITTKEIIASLKTQDYFFKNGVFDKATYKQVLSQNRLSTKEYEAGLKKELLIKKVFTLLPVEVRENETQILNTTFNIADKINYKVLTEKAITLEISDALLKPFWETKKEKFMKETSYDVKFIKQNKVTATYDDKKILKYYNENKTHFKSNEGKILPLESAKKAVNEELNAKATKDKALRTYIAYKKAKLDPNTTFETATISPLHNPFNNETLEKITKLSLTSPYMKPVLVDDTYYIFELIKINPATPKSFKEAKDEVVLMFKEENTKVKLQELANNSVDNFKGTSTDFLRVTDGSKLTLLEENEASEFLQKLFISDKKRSYIKLDNGNIILYSILEQKLLKSTKDDLTSSMKTIKSGIFNEALIKNLRKAYQTEIFIQGL